MHNVHRGVVVKQPTEADVRDIYIVRRSLEVGAIRPPPTVAAAGLEGLRSVVASAEASMRRADWRLVSTLNLEFHQRLVGVRGSPRLDAFFANLLAELRLAFASVADQAEFLSPYVGGNRRLCDLVVARRWEESVTELEAYLERSEQTVLDAVRRGS